LTGKIQPGHQLTQREKQRRQKKRHTDHDDQLSAGQFSAF
jgi:hypothetical protein